MTISGVDIYQRFGIRPILGAYNELVNYPSLKSVESNDWAEEDGLDVDLSEPKIDSKKVSIPFYCGLGTDTILRFINVLAQRPFIASFTALNRAYKLRLISNTKLQQISELGVFALDFSLDNPTIYSQPNPSSDIARCEDYLIDEIPFTDYGARVLDGALNNIIKAPSLKEPLISKYDTQNGAIVDEDALCRYKHKEVNIPILMRATNINEFWSNYDALLNALISPNARSLYVAALDRNFDCYYKSCRTKVFRITNNNSIWWEFTLIFVFINYRPIEQ